MITLEFCKDDLFDYFRLDKQMLKEHDYNLDAYLEKILYGIKKKYNDIIEELEKRLSVQEKNLITKIEVKQTIKEIVIISNEKYLTFDNDILKILQGTVVHYCYETNYYLYFNENLKETQQKNFNKILYDIKDIEITRRDENCVNFEYDNDYNYYLIRDNHLHETSVIKKEEDDILYKALYKDIKDKIKEKEEYVEILKNNIQETLENEIKKLNNLKNNFEDYNNEQ